MRPAVGAPGEPVGAADADRSSCGPRGRGRGGRARRRSSTGSLPGASNMRARPEAALPVGLAVVEARVGNVALRVDDRRRTVPVSGSKKWKPLAIVSDQPALLAQREAAEIFRRLPGVVLAGRRDRSDGSSVLDVDPPQHACRAGPNRCPRRARPWHRRRMSISIMASASRWFGWPRRGRAAAIAAAMSEKASLASETVTRITSAVDDEQRAVRKVERRQQAGQDGQHKRAGDRCRDSGRCRRGSRRRRSRPPRSR